ncbi:MAG: ABC transporter ATP-binding protein [Verrucomicrobiae bacterium]|nr:ABC transporter ATP-binding protein [Verrucomicrobiae bacterium]
MTLYSNIRSLLGTLNALFGYGGIRGRLLLAATCLAGILAALINIRFSAALQSFFADLLIQPAPENAQLIAAGVMLLWGVLRTTASYASLVLGNLSYEWNQSVARNLLMERLLTPSTPGHVLSSNAVSHCLGNLVPRSAQLMSSTSMMAGAIINLLVILAYLLWMSPVILAAAIVAGLVGAIPLFLKALSYSGHSAKVYAKTKSYQETAMKVAENLLFVRLHGLGHHFRNAGRGINRETLRAYWSYVIRSSFHSQWPVVVMLVLITLVVLLHGRLGSGGTERIVAICYLVMAAAALLSQILSGISQFRHSLPFARELTQVLSPVDISVETPAAPARSSERRLTRLSVRHLTYGWEGALTKSVDLEMELGDFCCINAPSGVGKTTLAMVLVGFLKPLSGEVLWNGQPISSFDTEWFRSRISYCGPNPFLIEGTIRDNLLMGCPGTVPDDSRLWEVLKMVEAGFVQSLPEGLSTRLGQQGTGLSSGQQQRLALARAVLRQPDVFLLDEATANIDETTEEVVFQNLIRHHPGSLFLCISHRTSVRRFGSRFLDLEQAVSIPDPAFP